MRLEGVVDALQRIHGWLRPDRILLDLQPEPVGGVVEVWQGGEVAVLGRVEQEEDIAKVRAARARLRLVESEGWFTTEAHDRFDVLTHFPSIEDWRDRQRQEGSSATVAADVLAEAGRRLSRGGGELVIREACRATRLRRLAAPSGSSS